MTMPTFGAGSRVYASDLNTLARQIDTNTSAITVLNKPLWTMSGTAATAGVTVEAVILTAPSSTYVAHTVYKVRFRGLIRSSLGTGTVTHNMRDTNVAGTLRFGTGQFVVPVVATNYEWSWWCYLANTTGTDITGRVVCLTMVGTGMTAIVNAGATAPYIWECQDTDLDTDHPGAIAL